MPCYARKVKNTSIQTTIAKALEREPLAFAYLVGSYARNRATPLSDIDVAVYVDENPAVSDVVNDLTTNLQTALAPIDVDVIELNRVGLPVLRSILPHAQPILIANPVQERLFRRNSIKRMVDFQPTLKLIGDRTIRHIRESARKRGIYGS